MAIIKSNIKNYTPHAVNLYFEDGTFVVLEPDGKAPRVSAESSCTGVLEVSNLGGGADAAWPIYHERLGEVVDLPEQEDNVFLIVSRMVCEARPDRTDLLYPAVLIRNSEGQIIGCAAFGSVAIAS